MVVGADKVSAPTKIQARRGFALGGASMPRRVTNATIKAPTRQPRAERTRRLHAMAHRKSIRARTADNQIYELRARPLRWVACSALAAKIAAPAKRDALLAGSRAASGKCASRKV